MEKGQKKFVVIDGNALIHRCFHALPPFKTSKGELINAVYGFVSILLSIFDKEKPDYVAVAFDKKGPTFRHVLSSEYKSTRVKAPDELYAQIPRVYDVVHTFGIQIFEKQGFEADDLIGTLAAHVENDKNLHTIIVTGDMDTIQLVGDRTILAANRTGFSNVIYYDRQAVRQRYGIDPEQMIDYKALVGDKSDNVLGLPGIGPKTAVDLLRKYDSIEGIYAHIDKLHATLRKKFEDYKEQVTLSRKLVSIVRDVPIEFDIDRCSVSNINLREVKKLFSELEFKALTKRLEKVFHGQPVLDAVAKEDGQLAMF